MKIIQLLILNLLLSAIAVKGFSDEKEFFYISPLPGSKYINPEQTITLKINEAFKTDIILKDYITIYATSSGEIDFETSLSDNNKVLFIEPKASFRFNEKVEIKINNIPLENSYKTEKLEFSFMIKAFDNTDLLNKYYQNKHSKSDPDKLETQDREDNSLLLRDNHYPSDYPVPEVNIFSETDDDYIFFTLSSRNSQYAPYLAIWDHHGIPVYYKRMQGQTMNFYKLNNGSLTYGSTTGISVINNRIYIMDSSYQVTDTLRMGNGYHVDMHDFLMLENGRYLMMSYDVQIIDMSNIVPGGYPEAEVTGLVIQEVDENQNVYFQWRSWDHFEITDAVSNIDLTEQTIDYVHGNAMCIDNDNQLLISCRHMDEITKIDRSSGDIIWRFGKHSENNQFTISDDPIGFSHQHDIRVAPNGNYTLYDNGNNHMPQVSQAMQYNIDEDNMEAALVWSYRHDPDIYAFATGSYQRTIHNKNLIGWGWYWPYAITEVDINGEKTFEIKLPNQVFGYRALKYSWETNLFDAPDLLDFGQFGGFKTQEAKTLPVTNTSDHTIAITSTHNHLDEFFLVQQFPVTIQPNETEYLTIHFVPTHQGYYNDILTLNYDNSSNTERIARQTNLNGYWDEIPPEVSITPEDGSLEIKLDTIIQVFFNEPVRKYGGGKITSTYIQENFIFKKDDQNGENIDFFGVINNEDNKIKIIPKDSLIENQQYFFKIPGNMIEDRAGNPVEEPSSSTFRTMTIVGNKKIISQDITIHPVPFHDKLFINNFKIQLRCNIYNINSKIIYSQMIIPGKNEINTSEFKPGIYLVKISDNTSKTVHYEKIIKN